MTVNLRAVTGYQLILMSHRTSEINVFVFVTHVLVLEEAQHLQFPEHPLGGYERLEHVRQLLQRDTSAVPRVRHRPGRNCFQIRHCADANLYDG